MLLNNSIIWIPAVESATLFLFNSYPLTYRRKLLSKTIVLLCVSLLGKCQQFLHIFLVNFLPSTYLANRVSAFRGASNTVSGQCPSVVAIQTPAAPFRHCNGVILNDKHIVTSAQCVYDSSNRLLHPFWLHVIAGDLNIMLPSFRRFTTDVSHIYPHPQYNPRTRANDIAILRVSRYLYYIFWHNFSSKEKRIHVVSMLRLKWDDENWMKFFQFSFDWRLAVRVVNTFPFPVSTQHHRHRCAKWTCRTRWCRVSSSWLG